MNMGMQVQLEPQLENEVEHEFEHKIQLEKAIPRVRIYIDEVNHRYYLDYFTFEALAFSFTIDGVPRYDLGNNTYMGDLRSQSVTIGEYSGLIEISDYTRKRIEATLKEGIEYVQLNVNKDLGDNLYSQHDIYNSAELPNFDDINSKKEYEGAALDEITNNRLPSLDNINDNIRADEENYGNEAYHKYGSHGSIRVPVEASELPVLDNLNQGGNEPFNNDNMNIPYDQFNDPNQYKL